MAREGGRARSRWPGICAALRYLDVSRRLAQRSGPLADCSGRLTESSGGSLKHPGGSLKLPGGALKLPGGAPKLPGGSLKSPGGGVPPGSLSARVASRVATAVANRGGTSCARPRAAEPETVTLPV